MLIFKNAFTSSESRLKRFHINQKNRKFYTNPGLRISICYDPQALESRKEHKPKESATGMASRMGIELLSEEQYHELQQYGTFDTRSSSWIITPSEIRQAGGAIFGDRRYGRVFIYHNGAESYYASRGFRGCLRV